MPLHRFRIPEARPEPPRFTRHAPEPLPWTRPHSRADARGEEPAGRSRRRPAMRAAAVALVISLVLLLVAAVAARAEVEPGRNLELNQSIEMGVLEGWPLGSTVRVDVLRGPTLIAWHDAHISDVGNKGGTIYDINHVGGSDCWNGVPPGTTPDVQPGDVIRATVLAAGGIRTADVDRTVVRDVAFVERGGVLVGHARGMHTSAGFDLTRPVALGDTLLMEAKRVGAPVDGEAAFAPDDIGADGGFRKPLGGTPHAGEVFIDTVEVTTGPGGEGTGITVAFPSDAEPEQPCGPLATSALTSVTAGGVPVDAVNRAMLESGTPLVVGGPRLLGAQTPAPDDVDVTVSLRLNGDTVPVVHSGAAWSASIPAATLATLPDNAPFTLEARFSDGSPPQSRALLKDATAPVVTASVPPGRYAVAQEVALASDGGEQVRYTLDGAEPGAGNSAAYDGRPIAIDRSRTIRAFAVDGVGNRGDATFAYDVAAPSEATAPSAATGRARPLALRALTMRRVLRLRAARRAGLRATLGLPAGTRVIVVEVRRGSRRVARTVRRVRGAPARYRLRLRSRALRRALRRGRYVLRVRVGPSHDRLGPAALRRFVIR